MKLRLTDNKVTTNADSNNSKSFFSEIKQFLRRKPKLKSLLSFLLFVVIATAIWIITATNNPKNSYVEISLPVKYQGFTNQYVFKNLPERITVKMNINGLDLLSYSFKPKRNDSIIVNLTKQDIVAKKLVVPEKILKELVSKELGLSNKAATISSIEPSSINVPFSKRSRKTVRVVSRVSVEGGDGYRLISSTIEPQTVDIYGDKNTLDTIKSVYTEQKSLKDLQKSVRTEVALKKMDGIYFSVDSVQIVANVEELTEKVFDLPLKVINKPSNYDVLLTPSNIELKISIPLSEYKDFNKENFEAYVDFNDIDINSQKTNDYLPVKLKEVPGSVVKCTTKPEKVTYIIKEK